jgi:uncharacterized protein (DUF2252 family)
MPRASIARLDKPPTTDIAEMRAEGRARRGALSRRSHAGWSPPKRRRDPLTLLRASNRGRLPEIAPIRIGRMLADPFAFMRGSAVVMASDLSSTPVTGFRVQACGDMHLLNLGLFATPERNLVFDINDFDETLPGPWEWDLKRLTASFVVAARSVGLPTGAEAAHRCATTYQERMAQLSELGAVTRHYQRVDEADLLALGREGVAEGDLTPAAVRRLEKAFGKARTKTSLQALSKLTTMDGARRVIVHQPPLVQPIEDEKLVRSIHTFMNRYRASLPDDRRRLLEQYHFVDAALKVVGVGSVGTRAFIVLLAGRAGLDPLFLQVKEARPSVFEDHAGRSAYDDPGRRVVEGQRLMQAASDIFLGSARFGPRSFYVRQLRDMKGSAEPETMRPAGYVRYAQMCGWALAQAHARTAHPARIAGYLGNGRSMADALVSFSEDYADQTERDHEALVKAVRAGKMPAIEGV